MREVTEHLDISRLDSDFSGMGQCPYHPLMLLRLLMWGMANRVVSTRRIEVLVHREVIQTNCDILRTVGNGKSGAYSPGWDEDKGQYFQAQSDELWSNEAGRDKAKEGNRRANAAG